jgi:hydroxymethylpyrimidine/phosphomethylpyrimidine kinase
MSNNLHTYVLAIGGLDPTAGAGILADVKAIEHAGAYAFAVASGLTSQDENRCYDAWWYDAKDIIKQIQPLLTAYDIKVIKIGAVGSLNTLKNLVRFIRMALPKVLLIWDPVLSSSSGNQFMVDWKDWWSLAPSLHLITPNISECLALSSEDTLEKAIPKIASYVQMYVKAGHQIGTNGMEYFVTSDKVIEVKKQLTQGASKHGSGCVFAATVAAKLALGKSYLEACTEASDYMSQFINSHQSKLGVHVR